MLGCRTRHIHKQAGIAKGAKVSLNDSADEQTDTLEDATSSPLETQAADEQASADLENAASYLRQRIIVYGLLAIFAAIALNDYRVRSQWEDERQVLSDTLIHSKGLPQSSSDMDALHLMRDGRGVDTWLQDLGYILDEDRSTKKVRVFVKDSGFREYWLTVDYHIGPPADDPYITMLNLTPESYYFWETRDPLPVTSQASASRESQQSDNQRSDSPQGERRGNSQSGRGGGAQVTSAPPGPGASGSGGGLFVVPDDPGITEDSDEDETRDSN